MTRSVFVVDHHARQVPPRRGAYWSAFPNRADAEAEASLFGWRVREVCFVDDVSRSVRPAPAWEALAGALTRGITTGFARGGS